MMSGEELVSKSSHHRVTQMAEREGFEPSVPFPVHILSRDAQSATLSPLLGKEMKKGMEYSKVNSKG